MYEEAPLARAGAGEVLMRVHAAAVTPTELELIRGVRVNVITTGPIKTPLCGRLGLPAEQASEVAASIQAQIPLRRFGTPVRLPAPFSICPPHSQRSSSAPSS